MLLKQMLRLPRKLLQLLSQQRLRQNNRMNRKVKGI